MCAARSLLPWDGVGARAKARHLVMGFWCGVLVLGFDVHQEPSAVAVTEQ